MQNAKIVTLYEFTITKTEWDALPTDYRAALATLCYAMNEIYIFSFLYGSSTDRPKDELVSKKSIILSNTMLRTLSAKLFEAIFGFRGLQTTLSRRHEGDETLLTILKQLDEKLSLLAQSDGFQVAKFVRDKACNHYLPQEIEKLIEFMPGRADKSLVLNDTAGDSFYPIGEEAVFLSTFNRLAKERNSTPGNVMNIWQEWTLQASETIIMLFNSTSVAMVHQFFPDKYIRQRKPYVEPRFLYGFEQQPLALFNFEQPVANEY